MKKDYAKLNYYDVWLPELAPSEPIMKDIRLGPFTEARWEQFACRYRSEMSTPEKNRMLYVLAALSNQTDFSAGCYCEDEDHCHRSILKKLFLEHGAEVV